MHKILITLLILSTTTLAAEKPILQIDPGGHKALIRDIIFTPDGRSLVSASDDKLIRVWNLKTGRTERTLRGQIGEGSEGKIFAMALSPDGRWLAAGGFMGVFGDEPIRLYNFHTGKLVALLSGHTNVVLSLAFSPDSRYLVSGRQVGWASGRHDLSFVKNLSARWWASYMAKKICVGLLFRSLRGADFLP
jgi:WD40 repeat protein